MDLQLSINEIDDPVFWKIVPGVQGSFPGAVELEGGFGYLDDKGGRRRVVVEEVARMALDHRHVRLRLRIRAEGKRKLIVHQIPVLWEYPSQNVMDEADGDGVWRILRTHLDDFPFDQFDRIALPQKSRVGKVVVLLARPAVGFGGRNGGHTAYRLKMW